MAKQTPTSLFFQKENLNKFADSPVFLTRPQEEKKKEKKKKKKQGKKNNRKKKMLV